MDGAAKWRADIEVKIKETICAWHRWTTVWAIRIDEIANASKVSAEVRQPRICNGVLLYLRVNHAGEDLEVLSELQEAAKIVFLANQI